MRTMLDAPAGTLEPSERTFVRNIEEHGWVRTGIADDAIEPGYSFTTGFWLTLRQPELIVFGLNGDVAHTALWTIFNDAKNGKAIRAGTRTDAVFENLSAYILTVAKRHYADFLGWSRWFYAGDDFPCAQIVWPDPAGLFPWETGLSSAFLQSQPDLTEDGWLAAIAN